MKVKDTVIDQDVSIPNHEPERVDGGVDEAIGEDDVLIIQASYCVVSCLQMTVRDRHEPAAVDIDPVPSRLYSDAVNVDILAPTDAKCVVSRVANGYVADCNAPGIVECNRVGTPVQFP